MTEPHTDVVQTGETYVSTGTLPARDDVRTLVETAYERFRDVSDGQVADYIPILGEADPSLFGICVANTRGDAFAVGDADHAISIQSVSKPFVFALVCDGLDPAEVAQRLGVDGTGLPFNSVMAFELRPDRTTNPMVNSGAIATFAM